MKARATLLGHPIHQILVAVPLGLFVIATVFDIIVAFHPTEALSTTSFWNIVAGVAGGLLASVFGLIDWTAIPAHTRAKRIGIVHALVNVVAVSAFAAAAVLRMDNTSYYATAPSLVLELGGFAIVGLGGWLGGELVGRLGIGVHEHAHADSPSSISGRPASDHATAPPHLHEGATVPGDGQHGLLS